MKSQTMAAAPRVPAPALAAIGALVLATLLAAAAARLSSGDDVQATDAPVLAQRHLRFDDQPDGSIRVTDARSGAQIERIANGSDAFIRSAVRGLVHERKRMGLDAKPPFELTARADGSLTLLDPATGRRIELQAFGRSNAGAFARLLPPVPAHRLPSVTRSATTP